MKKLLLGLITCGFVLGAEAPAPAMRYLAWLSGDIQNDYGSDSKKLREKVERFEADGVSAKDGENYIEYLTLLDAVGKGNAAVQKLQTFLAENPKNEAALFALANIYLRRQKVDTALYLYSKLEKSESFKMKSLLFNNLGMLALEKKNRRQAIALFKKATESNPQIAAPFVNLGALYLQSMSFDQAHKVFETARKLDSGFEDAAVGLAASLEGQGKFEAAHAVYDDYISDHPGAMTTLYNDALILGQRLNRRAEAANKLLQYVQRGGKATARAQELIQNWR